MIHLGSCEDVLVTLGSNSVDAVVTDPPYGLGNREPTAEELDRYLSGEALKTGDFMGHKWDIPSVAVWREVLRVLRPGRLLLTFGGTRTIDLISLGAQAAGFHKVGEFLWCYGSGFPKGGEVSKKIDKLKGKEPTVVGPDPEAKRRNKKAPRFNGKDFANGQVYQGASEVPLTEPGSEEGQLWKGWGSQLKPSWEPVWVFSKGEPTIDFDFSDPFIYCAKTSGSEKTLAGEVENDHPTVKPLKLMRQLIQMASGEGELVLDPYVGSGTTADACVLERRKYIAIERDPAFHAIATRRLEVAERPNLISSLLDQLEQE